MRLENSMIQFWNITRLKERIRACEITERETFGYLLVWLVIFPVLGAFGTPDTTSPTIWVWTTVYWVIFGIGLYFAYRENGGANGKDFTTKFLSIGFVEAIRFLPLTLLGLVLTLALNFMFYPGIMSGATAYTITPFEILIMGAVSVAYIWRVIVHVGDVK